MHHNENPSIDFRSVCIIDGDSKQKENAKAQVYRLPGGTPELTVFDGVMASIEHNIGLLTAGLQRPADKQRDVQRALMEVSQTNRDAHLLFSQVGQGLGILPLAVVEGAFLATWSQENESDVKVIAGWVKDFLDSASSRS